MERSEPALAVANDPRELVREDPGEQRQVASLVRDPMDLGRLQAERRAVCGVEAVSIGRGEAKAIVTRPLELARLEVEHESGRGCY